MKNPTSPLDGKQRDPHAGKEGRAILTASKGHVPCFATSLVIAAAIWLSAALGARADTIYVACNNPLEPIVEINSDGTISGVSLPPPVEGVAVDPDGNVYFSSTTVVGGTNVGNISMIKTDGTISIVADGFNANPAGLAFDGGGNLCAAAWDTIYKITPNGTVSTVATGLNRVATLAFDGSGNLYVAECLPDGWIDKIAPNGTVSTFASGLKYPSGLACDASGNLYLANAWGGDILKYTPSGAVSEFASVPEFSEDLAFDSSGNLLVITSDANGNGMLMQITPDGVQTTLATGLDNPEFIAVQTPEPSSLALLALGALGLTARRRRR
jgi:sugar lactone lactonase YvrE